LFTNDPDRELIIQWYEQYSDHLFKYIVKMVKDVHQAEDITQETFIRAYKAINLRSEINNPKLWLYRIAHNLTVDYIRKQAPIKLIRDYFVLQNNEPSTEEIIEIRENAKELYNALQNLKPSYREVIILRKIEGFSIRETANILNCSESKVKTKLFRALQALKNQLIKEGGVQDETS
jgi:RNA polymerase sigma-70 factor (ECF subfamily)